jgi:uncharacterized protein (TIGR03435 family)
MNPIVFLSTQPWVERLGWTLVHFLWQGVSIAVLYAIAREWLSRSESAQLRYILACATLLAMLAAPIATFIAARLSTAAPAPTLSAAIPLAPPLAGPGGNSAPFHSLPSTASRPWRNDLMPWVVVTWVGGAIVLCMRFIGGWVFATRLRSAQVRAAPREWKAALDALRIRVRVSAPVRLLISALVQVPTVIGWMRPAILLPVGALTGLPAEHIEALLAHELAHIRRRDYLVNVLQSVAEALLFYHPAVWWVSGHIRMERELCCDDIAAAVSGDMLTYVSALASMEAHRPEHLTHSLAANGGSLQNRIARLLSQPRMRTYKLPGLGALVGGSLLTVAAVTLGGQFVDARPAFDVASVKGDKSETGVDRIKFPGCGGCGSQISKGSLIIENVSLKRIIGMAYGVAEGRDYLLSGPDWFDSERFDIHAKFPPESASSEMLLMLQRLLDERFQLKLHREAREFSVYALVAGKAGPKLQRSPNQEGPYQFSSRGGHAIGVRVTMQQFAGRLSRPDFQLGRQIVDFTGLTGTFDLALDWRPESDQVESLNDDSRPSIVAALAEQLGLKLEPRKVSRDVLVVDHALKVPIEN